MSYVDVFVKYYEKLVVALPMDDMMFTARLFSHGVLPGNLKQQVQSQTTSEEKATYFLDHKINPDVTISNFTSFDTLLQVMENWRSDSLKELAKEIKTTLMEGTTTGATSPKKSKQSTIMDEAIDGLRAMYLGQLPTAKTDWPKHQMTKYLRLALVEKEDVTLMDDHLNKITQLSLRGGVDKILKKKQPLDDLRDIFYYQNKPCPRLILIMGGPGIGKTTLVNEICVRWARDGLLADNFKLVILILLRTVRQCSLEDIVVELIGERAYQLVKESNGSKCLIILDGLDEISGGHRVRTDLFLAGLIRFTTLKKATILITSRPHACQELVANRTIEVVGFGEDQIKEFVTKMFSDDVETFLQQAHDLPHIYDLCYVPMSLVMVTQIFQYRKMSLPSTLTELYKLFVVMILCREKKKSIEKKVIPPAIATTAEENLQAILPYLPKEMTEMLLLLCKLAYHSFFTWCSVRQEQQGYVKKIIRVVKEPKIIFTEEDLVGSGIELPKEFDGQGLLQVATIYQLTRDSVTYNFSHLTVQEFLCALYICVTLSQEEQYHILQENFNILPNIITMFCGVTGLKSQEHLKFILSQLSSGSDEYGVATAVKCIYESQCILALQEISPLTMILRETTTLSPYDIQCISYTICHYPIVVLNMLGCHIGDKGVSRLVQYCVSKNILLQLQEFNLALNGLTSAVINSLVQIIRSSPSLRVLNVDLNKLGDIGVKLLCKELHKNTSLTKLSVWACELSVKGAICIKTLLMENKTITSLYIDNNDIGDEGVASVCQGLHHNKTVTVLYMWRCGFSVKGAICIKTLLMENRKLQGLNIGNNQINDEGVAAICEVLHHNTNVTEIRMDQCGLSVEGAICIKTLLMENKTVASLDISYNIINDEGAVIISEGLRSNHTLTTLWIWHCGLSVEGSRVVLQAAVDNTVCYEVGVDGEHESDDQVKQLMTILEERKRQVESNNKSEDDYSTRDKEDVTMTKGDHHGNTSYRLQDNV